MIRLCITLAVVAATAPASVPTFHQDIELIVQRRCQRCHRPGEAAPFSMLTYKDARPWAKSIRDAVVKRIMPPWSADPRFLKFIADGSLAQSEIDAISAWVNGGAPEGDPADAPRPIPFVEGWIIGEPEMVIALPRPFQIPAKGTVDYQHFVIPSPFKEDTWVRRAEIRPTARDVVHHVIVYAREPGSRWLEGAKPGEPLGLVDAEVIPAGIVTGYAPGVPPTAFGATQGILIKAGSDLVIQMHYSPNGKATTDQTKVGLIFAKEAPKERVVSIAPHNHTFTIPAGDPDYRVDTSVTFTTDSRVMAIMPHMHYRGKSFEYRIVYPTGEKEVLMRVPAYDFNWQLIYGFKRPLVVTKGTRIECEAHYDNSSNNRANPDPAKAVRWGDQTWEEMMIGWMYVTADPHADLRTLLRESAAIPGGQ